MRFLKKEETRQKQHLCILEKTTGKIKKVCKFPIVRCKMVDQCIEPVVYGSCIGIHFW